MEIHMKRVTLGAVVFASLALFGSTLQAGDPVVAVADFRNDTSAGWWSGGVGRDLAGMLSNELSSTEKFRVVERSKLNAVLDEQDLAESGRVSKGTGAKIGKLTGAKYLIIGTVTAYEENTSGGGGGVSYHGIGIGGRKDEAYIAVDVRVIDTTTGEISYSRTVEARSGGYGLNVGVYRGGFGGNLGKYEKTPAGKAIRAVLMEISEYLGCAMVDQDSCMSEYAAKEKSRRDKTKKAIKLD
jgi:curli biogenesis system outer membrane secretion channel CsgG